jgi:hypothetical protein
MNLHRFVVFSKMFVLCLSLKTLCFFFVVRNGENFVYHTSDWKNYPEKATFYLVILTIASVTFHLIFNFIHELRRKFHEHFVMQKVSFKDENESCIKPQEIV